MERDEVRLMVSWPHVEEIQHTEFRRLPQFLQRGDVLVVNNSANWSWRVSGSA